MHTEKKADRQRPPRRPGSFGQVPWEPVAFFVLFFLYVWLRIEPAVRYHDLEPVFLLDASFFRQHLTYPGGWVDYVASFLAQLSCDNRLGALVSTGLGALLFLATWGLLRQTPGAAAPSLALVPPFLVLLLHNAYTTPVLALGVRLLLALGLGCAYGAQSGSGNGVRLGGCWAGAALAFCAAGTWSCVVFSTVCCCHELAVGRRRWLGLACLSSALVAPLWMVISQGNPPPMVHPPPIPGWAVAAGVGLYLFVPLAILVRAWLAGRAARSGARGLPAGRGGISRPGVPVRRFGLFGRFGRVFRMSLFLLGWVLVWLSFDGQQKSLLELNYHAEEGQWEKVLRAGSRLRQLDDASGINLIRALQHAGRLPEDLFAFPIPGGFDFLPGLSGGIQSCRSQSELLLELGHVNAAEHLAHEAFAWEGERPALLRLLARINVLLNRPRAARAFLNVLRKVPFHRGWAENALRCLESDPAWPEDPEVARIRGVIVTTDQPGGSMPTERFLEQSLQHNPRNRVAFEYLMVRWLLGLDLDKVAAGMERLSEFGYDRVPRHYEEAFLLHQNQRQPGHPVADPPGLSFRPETRQRFARFLESLRRGDLDTRQGRQSFLGEFGDTYWVYHLAQQRGRTPGAPASAKP